ncbi:TIR domain-containing protein [Microbulbifer sp.]|uniref:TIR domain-containing protein n=1 Tax=Microbulbifer sp. TaxID=1908541 RepID=UPI002587EECC|nr:TIR domain-containing protein [Microbulbifer sp.]
MIERFEGTAGRAVLEEVLLQQKLVLGNEGLASRLADVGTLEGTAANQVLITQSAEDSDVYFIISGRFKVQVHGREVAIREPGEHVGEMSALVPTTRRSASLIATEPSIVLKVSAADFKAAANEFPRVWQQITQRLADRLNQRNDLVRPANQSALVFIICSTEALDIARAIENNFAHDKFFTKIWTEGTFQASEYPIESLEAQLDECDFAIAIGQPDDEVRSREEVQGSPRDNVIFELGLSVGRLGRTRSFLLEPREDEVRLPSDLAGLTTISYRPARGKNLQASLGPACNQLRDIFNELGPR